MYEKVKKPEWSDFYENLFGQSYEKAQLKLEKHLQHLVKPERVKVYQDKIIQIAKKQTLIVKTKKGDLEIPVRIPCNGEVVTVDALNCVVGGATFGDFGKFLTDNEIDDDNKLNYARELAYHIGGELSNIFGSDFSDINYMGRKLHFYQYGFTIGHPDAILGKIGIGGQGDTVLIMISGTGCQYGNEFWEYNLYNWLKNDTKNGKLTRIDFAHDDFDGKYSSPEIADLADSQGMFALTNRLPSVQHIGDWKRHQGRGRTFQVGKRENGKLYRGYEKGKQQGDKESAWFRSEVEFGSAGKHLELEMLIYPSQYFAGAYPYCLELVEHAKGEIFTQVSRIPCVQKEAEISLDKSVEIWKRQAGRYIAVYRELFVLQDDSGKVITDEHGKAIPDDTKILNMLMTDKADYYPKRLKVIEKFVKNPPSYAPWADVEEVSVPI